MIFGCHYIIAGYHPMLVVFVFIKSVGDSHFIGGLTISTIFGYNHCSPSSVRHAHIIVGHNLIVVGVGYC